VKPVTITAPAASMSASLLAAGNFQIIASSSGLSVWRSS
jgi:hypothetical protein